MTSTRDNDERVTVGEITAAVQDSEAPGEHLIPDSFETFWPKLVAISVFVRVHENDASTMSTRHVLTLDAREDGYLLK
ncbi:hypothetical protein PC129_g1112 [Phytophthora cactorum]|uniref:Uncharacterized protein n=1 Tax=Phytophthora cactorum TaxID=29920 RepID=A0A329SVF1_9STRA|nr:hypothetical protein PC113_g2327 [Phytophthora cactorum]KAG2930524.1 hypothetical protein PC114_g2435 [Phytophthora cactorum]KAG3068573.1 hypothetical protein PC121_g10164 [Phytophthora cactorum]KAG3183156.1 hypothetical protein PC128_g14339 [Phytophthora cactorum]KAG3228353.1 hypothetical protein PC129_g1112 [Phytophthora cactorum]